MCGPTAMLVVSLAGTALSAYGQMQQGKAAQSQANYQAAIARNNQTIAQQNADAALDKGRSDKEDARRENAQRAGLQKAQLAAQGFDVAEGTSIDILADTAALGELDALRIDADAQSRARNYIAQGNNFEAEANLHVLSGKNSKQAGKVGAFSTLLGGAGNAYGSYLDRTA